MRAFVVSLALLAAAPATASAAFGQVQPVTVSKNEECLGATGRPGEISASAFGGVRFLVATREGFQPGGKVELGGEFFQCDAIAAHPSGAGVIVGHESTTTDDGGFEERYVASIRDPSGTWGEGVELPVDQDWWRTSSARRCPIVVTCSSPGASASSATASPTPTGSARSAAGPGRASPRPSC